MKHSFVNYSNVVACVLISCYILFVYLAFQRQESKLALLEDKLSFQKEEYGRRIDTLVKRNKELEKKVSKLGKKESEQDDSQKGNINSRFIQIYG